MDVQAFCPHSCHLLPIAALPHASIVSQPVQTIMMASLPMAPHCGSWTWPEGAWLGTYEQPTQQVRVEDLRSQIASVCPSRMTEVPTGDDATPLRDSAATSVSQDVNIATGCWTKHSLPRAKRGHKDDERDADSELHESSEGVAEAMVEELLRQLGAGADEQKLAIASFQRLAFADKVSCWAAQLALERASGRDAALLACGLRGRVRQAVQSKYANYVLQKIIEVMPIARASFVVDELLGFACGAARHRFGCRILCRVLEHVPPKDETIKSLLDELLAGVGELVCHSYGTYVARHILEFGLNEHRHRVACALLPHVPECAQHKLGSHLVESALRLCSPEDQVLIAEALVHDDNQFVTVATSEFGRHVVRNMLGMSVEVKRKTAEAIGRIESKLRSSKSGHALLQALR